MPGLKEIIINRAEGPREDCRETRHSSIDDANKRLYEISATAPKDMGYDKTDVTLVWDDGATLKSRHDIKHFDTDGNVLTHPREFLLHILRDDGLDIADEEKASAAELLKRINLLLKGENYEDS